MLKQRHRRDAPQHELTAEAEARIRADERRRVLAERDAGMDDDWRTTPPAPDEPRVQAPGDRTDTPSTGTPRTGTDDPPGWDVRDDADTRRDDADTRRDDADTRRDERAAPASAPAVVHEETVVERGFSPGQILILLSGAAMLLLGVVAIIRAGLDGPLSEPVDTVLWWDHTALLGLIEIGAGVLLILGALHPAMRWLGGLVGLALIVAGVLILAELEWAMDELGTERVFGWAPMVVGAVAVIGAAIPRIRRTRVRSQTTDHSTATS